MVQKKLNQDKSQDIEELQENEDYIYTFLMSFIDLSQKIFNQASSIYEIEFSFRAKISETSSLENRFTISVKNKNLKAILNISSIGNTEIFGWEPQWLLESERTDGLIASLTQLKDLIVFSKKEKFFVSLHNHF